MIGKSGIFENIKNTVSIDTDGKVIIFEVITKDASDEDHDSHDEDMDMDGDDSGRRTEDASSANFGNSILGLMIASFLSSYLAFVL